MPLLSKGFLDRQVPVFNYPVPDPAEELHQIAVKSLISGKRFDIFLSHAFIDAEYILKLYEFLSQIGFTVFVDWIDAPELDRSNVTSGTADLLRRAMKRSESLLFAASPDTKSSKWMPWELGFSDALHGKVAIIPIREAETSDEIYREVEYLGLYPYVTSNPDGKGKAQLWVNWSTDECVSLADWVEGSQAKKLSYFKHALRMKTGVIDNLG